MNLTDAFTGIFEDYWRRIDEQVDGLSEEELFWSPAPHANPIGFIAWHLARVEDDWMTIFAQGKDDIWASGGWFTKFGLGDRDMGLRVSPEWLENFPRFPMSLLDEYKIEVREETKSFFSTLDEDSLRFVPGRTCVPEFPDLLEIFKDWSIARMLRQVSGEINQHLGQISYLRGLQRGFDG